MNSRLRKSSWNNTIKKWDMLLDSKANFLVTLTVTVLCIFSQLRCFIFPGLFCPTLNIEILDDNFYAKYFCFLTLFQITKFLWNTDYDIRELYIVCRIKKELNIYIIILIIASNHTIGYKKDIHLTFNIIFNYWKKMGCYKTIR